MPQLHAVYHNPDGHVDVRFLAQSGLATPVSGQTTATAGDTLTVAASTSRVTPLSQIAHNIALQHRMEKMIAEVRGSGRWEGGGFGGVGGGGGCGGGVLADMGRGGLENR